MKGFLKSTDGVFHLLPKVTTIGREACNLIIQSASVASQHAVIEYCDSKDWFVLQDLDTVLGTSVNGCLIQNSAVQLKPGDVIRFGSHPVLYELHTDTQNKALSPTQGHFSVRNHLRTSPSLDSNAGENVTLPQLIRTLNNTAIVNWPTVSSRHGSAVLPRPLVTLRPKPLSTMARRPSTEKLPQAVMLETHAATESVKESCHSSSGCSSISPQSDDLHVQMKYLSEEVKRLRDFETSSHEKEETIIQLRSEVSSLQRLLRQKDVGQEMEPEVRLRMLQLDTKSRKMEVQSQANHDCPIRIASAGITQNSNVSEIRNGCQEISGIQSPELEQLKKEKNLTMGFVSQMQRDMASKDVIISRLTKEVEELKKDNIAKENNLIAFNSTLESSSDGNINPEENAIQKEKEIAILNHKLKASENQKQASNEAISVLRKELSQMKASMDSSQASINQKNLDLKTASRKYEDLERAERLVRVALEQISKRLEKLRSHVIQTAYCAPGVKIPDNKVSDDDLLQALKTCTEERTELAKKIKAFEEKQGTRKTASTVDGVKKLKQQMSESVTSGVKKT